MDLSETQGKSALVKKTEAAETLQVTVRTIDRYIKDGTLQVVRLSPRATRITRESLDALVGGAA